MEDEPLRTSTPILNGSLRSDPVPAVLDGSMALAQLSLSMAKAQAGGEAEKRRDIFSKYLHKELAALRYAISQDMLSGNQGGSLRMYGTGENTS